MFQFIFDVFCRYRGLEKLTIKWVVLKKLDCSCQVREKNWFSVFIFDVEGSWDIILQAKEWAISLEFWSMEYKEFSTSHSDYFSLLFLGH